MHRFTVTTKGIFDIVDITERVASSVAKATEDKDGIAVIFAPHSTVGLTLIENEPGLIEDFKEVLAKIAPPDKDYRHDEAWGEKNGHSHILSSLLKPSLTIPIESGKLALGSWQQIVLVDFDSRPRKREIIIQVLGTGQ